MKNLILILISVLMITSCSERKNSVKKGDKLKKKEIKMIQSPVGNWVGDIVITEKNRLKVTFIIEKKGDKFSGKMGSPNQMMPETPVDSVIFEKNIVKIEFKKLNVTFEGELKNKNSFIEGKFTQHGQSFPLNLKKVENLNSVKPKYSQLPKKPYPYIEEFVTFKNKKVDIELAGTLTYPKSDSKNSKFPAIILIAGSGPNDRDETPMKHFLLLADRLTKQGFVVLRFDKRGIKKSKGDYQKATTFDFAEDVFYGVEYLLTKKFVKKDKIGLFGHSEGAMIAPVVAAQRDDISFLILMGTPGLSGEKVILQQSEDLLKVDGVKQEDIDKIVEKNREIYKVVKTETDSEKLNRKILKIEPTIGEKIKLVTKPWFKTFLTFEPAKYLEKMVIPVFVMSGEKDLQVAYKENNKAIKEALDKAGNKNYEIKVFKNLNHLFQKCETGSVGEYGKIDEVINESALKSLKLWLDNNVLN